MEDSLFMQTLLEQIKQDSDVLWQKQGVEGTTFKDNNNGDFICFCVFPLNIIDINVVHSVWEILKYNLSCT